MAQKATEISFPGSDSEKTMKSGQETFRFGSNAVEHSDEKMARLQVAVPVFYQRCDTAPGPRCSSLKSSRESASVEIVCSAVLCQQVLSSV